MRLILLLSLFCSFTALADYKDDWEKAGWKLHPTPYDGKGDYCKDDAYVWIKQRFGQDAQVTGLMLDKASIPEKAKTGFTVRVWSNLCKDQFILTYGFFGVDECKREQWYKEGRQQLVYMAGAIGDCRQHMKRPYMEYPTLDYSNLPAAN